MAEELVYQLRKAGTHGPHELARMFEEHHLAPKEILDKIVNTPRTQIISKGYHYSEKLQRGEYESKKRELQIELVKLQNWIKREDKKLVLVFEGRDAAGKGGAIKRFTEHMNPRGARVVALEKPSETEQGQWYFQRYVDYLPSHGEVVFFDRSWYNRAGVEKVMNFCSDEEYDIFTKQVFEFEKMLINGGISLIKLWFSVSREEQLRRLMARMMDPLKQWKLSQMDIISLAHWDSYTKAKFEMFEFSDHDLSPWTVVKSDCKKRARLEAMRYTLSLFDYTDKRHDLIAGIDSNILGRAEIPGED